MPTDETQPHPTDSALSALRALTDDQRRDVLSFLGGYRPEAVLTAVKYVRDLEEGRA